jgi:DNA polymerase V
MTSPKAACCSHRYRRPGRRGGRGVMTVMDDINRRWGRGTLRYLAEGVGQPWRMRRERLSPAYTTRWGELLGVG